MQGRYELIGLLGQGGMGTVYMARDRRLHNRACVVKKLRDDFYREEDKMKAVGFFQREAGVLSQLQHPNIVHILDYFNERNDYFLVMEYVEGRDLFNILKERGEPFSEEQVLDWAAQICDVLEYLHEHDPPVIYRDLKPSNIMLDVKGRVKLVDFGIARPCEENTDGTHVVSAGYSPPEQYWGAADPRSDIYALGATMHYLLTGQDPLALHASSPRSVNPRVSDHTDHIVRRATDQDAGKRYQTARELTLALTRPEPEQPTRPSGRKMEVLVGVAILAVGCILMFAYVKLDAMLRSKTDELESTEAIIKKKEMEKRQLTEKLNAYSRAMEAHERAVLEWQDGSVAAKSKQTASRRSATAAQMADEEQLTDPEGLAPLNGEGQHTGLAPLAPAAN